MEIEDEKTLFKYWKNMGKTPQRLVEDYVGRHCLPKEEEDVILRIIKFCIRQELAKLDPMYYKDD